MAADMFLKIETIDGESNDTKHGKEIEILHYSFGVTQQATMGYGGGGGAGKASFQDLSFSKRIDKASPNLFVACATGKHIPKITLTVRKAGGDQQEYLTITMSDCIISSYHESGSEGAMPLENISFNFTECKYDYKPQLANGQLGGSVIGGYNIKEQRKVG